MGYKGLKVGMWFSNYKQLCEFLQEKVKSGKAKIIQTGEWSMQFTVERQRNSWKILSVHPNPKAKLETLSQIHLGCVLIIDNLRKSINKDNIPECLIEGFSEQSVTDNLNLFEEGYFNHNGVRSESSSDKYRNSTKNSENKNENKNENVYEKCKMTFCLNKKDLLLLTGMVNENFGKIGSLTDEFIRNFFTTTRSVSYPFILNSLNFLGNEGVVVLNKSYKITKDGKNLITNLEQHIDIISVYREVLNHFGALNLAEIYITGKTKVFHREVGEKLKNRFNITYYEEVFLLTTTKFLLDSYINSLEQVSKNFREVFKQSNEKSVARISKHFNTAYTRHLRKSQETYGGLRTEYVEDLDEDYLKRNFNLVNCYIDIEGKLK